MADTFDCPFCGAALEPAGSAATIACQYCGKSVDVPVSLRQAPAPVPVPVSVPMTASMPDVISMDSTYNPAQKLGEELNMLSHLSREQALEIVEQVRAGQKLEAIKLYRAATNASLEQARMVIDRIEMVLMSPKGQNLEEVAMFAQMSSTMSSLPVKPNQARGLVRGCVTLIVLAVIVIAALIIWAVLTQGKGLIF